MLRAIALCLLLSLGSASSLTAFAQTTDAQAVVPAPEATETPGHKVVIFFQEWSARFDDAATGAIASAAEWAKQNPETTLTVSGFADPTGSVQSNIYLAQLRAERVYDELVAAGVTPGRIKRTGKGETGFQLNGLESRRVEISFHDS